MNEKKKQSKVARYVGRTILVAVLLVVILVAALLVFLDYAAAAAVRKVTPMLTGTEVALDGVNFRLADCQMRMNKFVIGNPKGYATPSAIEFSTFFVDIDRSTVFDDKIYINEVLIADPVITLEQGLAGSNLTDIQKHVEKATAKTETDKDKPAAVEEPGESEAQKKVVIRKLTIEGAKINIGLKGVAPVPVFLPTLTLNDIGEDSDFTVAQTVDYVFNEVLISIVAAARDAGVDLGAVAGQLLAGAGEALADVAGATGSKMVEAVSGAGEGLGGILNVSGDKSREPSAPEVKADAAAEAEAKPVLKLELK